jgi:hypothetical protein
LLFFLIFSLSFYCFFPKALTTKQSGSYQSSLSKHDSPENDEHKDTKKDKGKKDKKKDREKEREKEKEKDPEKREKKVSVQEGVCRGFFLLQREFSLPCLFLFFKKQKKSLLVLDLSLFDVAKCILIWTHRNRTILLAGRSM